MYARGRTAVLSASGLTVRCFTVPSPILQALRTTFFTYPDRPRLLSAAISPEPVGEPVVATCIRDRDRRVLRVFTDQVSPDWSTSMSRTVPRSCFPSSLISYAINNQLGHPKPPTRGFRSFCFLLAGSLCSLRIIGFHAQKGSINLLLAPFCHKEPARCKH